MTKEIEYVVVSYSQYTDYEFVEPGSFFIMSATQDYYFFKTSDRAKAQAKCNELFGVGKYSVVPSKTMKVKPKSESGELSCRGTATRKK